MATEKRLIDANACPTFFEEKFKETMALIRNGETHLDNLAEGFTEASQVIWLMSIYNAVDAVEVIRCKDCKKWFRHTEVDRERGECRRYQTTKHETGYCDRGERKDNVL